MGNFMQFGNSFREYGSDSTSQREPKVSRDRVSAASVGAAALACIGLLGLAGCSDEPTPEQAAVSTTTSSTTRETTTPRSTTTRPTTPVQSSVTPTTSPAPPIEPAPAPPVEPASAPPVVLVPAPIVDPAPAPLVVPAPAPIAAPVPAPQPVQEYVPPAAAVSFANCGEAKAAGAAPIYEGSPGYAKKLDRDGDGIACDK